MALDETFREHEGDDYFCWMEESAHELEEYAEAHTESAAAQQLVAALSGFSLSAWLSR